jgi:hypothetical protein
MISYKMNTNKLFFHIAEKGLPIDTLPSSNVQLYVETSLIHISRWEKKVYLEGPQSKLLRRVGEHELTSRYIQAG